MMDLEQDLDRPPANVTAQARRAIETHSLVTHGEQIVVGVSGGPDSVCLLHVLLQLRNEYDLCLHVAHLHHGARAADADADLEFVEALAVRWGLPISVERRDVPELARIHQLAFEETARRVRYAFLARVARDVGAAKVAVGHTADDQAETVLMHWLRGAGPAGLRGMLPATPLNDYRLLEPLVELPSGLPGGDAIPRQGLSEEPLTVIRPLLQTTRAEVEAYCAAHSLDWRFDRSNLDTTYFRNRLREELLPLLEGYNPNIRQRLCHMAAVVAADYELLTAMRAEAWAEVVREERPDTIVLARSRWQALPVALQRATIRHAAYQLRRSLRDVDFVHVENARMVALHGNTGARATLPMGLVLSVGYETLTLSDVNAASPLPDEPLLPTAAPIPVKLPGTTELPDSRWVLQARYVDNQALQDKIGDDTNRWAARLDAAALNTPLVLRTRRRGDRFQPQGLGGHTTKLSAFMINTKIPQAWRDYIPLLDAAGQIVWVAGYRVAQNAATGPQTTQVAALWFEQD